MISAMIDDITSDNAVDAQEKFNNIVAQKVTAAFDARKADVAASIYSREPNEVDPSA